MSVFADVIVDVRLELNDTTGSRFTSDECMAFLKKAVRRAAHTARQYGLEVAKKESSYTATPLVTSFALPSDFYGDAGLWRTDTCLEIKKADDREWSLLSLPECALWKLDMAANTLSVKSTPGSDIGLKLLYYYCPVISTLTTTSTIPYGEWLYDLLVEYAAIRMKNVDEMDFSVDAQLMTDLENRILATVKSHGANSRRAKGWC